MVQSCTNLDVKMCPSIEGVCANLTRKKCGLTSSVPGYIFTFLLITIW
ncbi:hypothetical protein E2C01_021965 [Portunus trituberculatus]|uniref:Uncharacterized protein n=1 Tax=Portunus trituberculatus TaxID=210409 RepID=A0A5B7E607_PORTR|nr:hypothetical protein [Portunus trituberculatus]